MVIECSECREHVWCCWDEDHWICKRCFVDYGSHTYQEWQELNEENKRYREEKRRREAFREAREW